MHIENKTNDLISNKLFEINDGRNNFRTIFIFGHNNLM